MCLQFVCKQSDENHSVHGCLFLAAFFSALFSVCDDYLEISHSLVAEIVCTIYSFMHIHNITFQIKNVFNNVLFSTEAHNPLHAHLLALYIMEWWSVEGQDTGSRVSKTGDHCRRMAAIGFYLLSRRQFSAHTKSSLAHIDKRTARAARNTCYRYNKICPLDHKMADNCVSLARTNTVSSTRTKPIKT